jgi:hypothetical protein
LENFVINYKVLEYKFQLNVFFKIGFSNLFKYFILYSNLISNIFYILKTKLAQEVPTRVVIIYKGGQPTKKHRWNRSWSKNVTRVIKHIRCVFLEKEFQKVRIFFIKGLGCYSKHHRNRFIWLLMRLWCGYNAVVHVS